MPAPVLHVLRGPSSIKVAPGTPRSDNLTAFHEPSGMTPVINTGKITTLPTSGSTFGSLIGGIFTIASGAANLQLAGRGRSGLRVCFPSSVAAGTAPCKFNWTIPNQVTGTPGTNGSGLSSLVKGSIYARWKQRYDEMWVSGTGTTENPIWSPFTVSNQYGGPGPTEAHNVGTAASASTDTFFQWSLTGPGSQSRLIPTSVTGGYPVTDPLGNLAGLRRYGAVPTSTPLGIHGRLRGLDVGVLVNVNYPGDPITESFDYTQSFTQLYGGITTEEVAFQERHFIVSGTSATNVVFSWTGSSGNSADKQVSLAQSLGAKIKPYIFEGQTGVPMTSTGNWVSNKAYTTGQGAYDTANVVGSTPDPRWFVCTNNVTSTTRPGLDATNWKKQTYSPDIYNTLTAPSAGDGSNTPGFANALALMNTIVDGYALHWNTQGTPAAYNPATAYTANQTVTYLGKKYTCWTNTTGHVPTDYRFWIHTEGLDGYVIANEVLDQFGGNDPTTSIMPSPWFALIGPTWVSKAAQRLHIDDPNAIIAVNLNNIELNTSSTTMNSQQKAAVALASGMIAAGGIGTRQLAFTCEAHLNCSQFVTPNPQFTAGGLQVYWDALTAMDVLVGFSELDMYDDVFMQANNPAFGIANQTNRDNAVGAALTTVLNAATKYAVAGMMKEVLLWGYSDRISWRNWPPNGSPNISANLGDWVSGQAYATNVGVFDTVAGKWYSSNNPITSTTRPGLDVTNWTQASPANVPPQRTDGLLGRPCLVDANYNIKPAFSAFVNWLNSLPYERETHVCEMLVVPETSPGASNGSAYLWVDGNLANATTSGVQWLGVGNIPGWPLWNCSPVYSGTATPPTPSQIMVTVGAPSLGNAGPNLPLGFTVGLDTGDITIPPPTVAQVTAGQNTVTFGASLQSTWTQFSPAVKDSLGNWAGNLTLCPDAPGWRITYDPTCAGANPPTRPGVPILLPSNPSGSYYVSAYYRIGGANASWNFNGATNAIAGIKGFSLHDRNGTSVAGTGTNHIYNFPFYVDNASVTHAGFAMFLQGPNGQSKSYPEPGFTGENYVAANSYAAGHITLDTAGVNEYLALQTVPPNTPPPNATYWRLITTRFNPYYTQGAFQNTTTPTMIPIDGQFHLCELLVTGESVPGAGDGKQDYWIDNVHIFHADGVNYLATGDLPGFSFMQFDPTWGGAGAGGAANHPLQTQYVDFNRVYVANL